MDVHSLIKMYKDKTFAKAQGDIMPREKNKTATTSRGGKVAPKKKLVTIYKTDKKVTIRKPRAKDEYVTFTVEVDEGKASKDGVSLVKAKNFVKHVVTTVKDINFLKNDMGFLMSEIYGADHSTDASIDVYTGKVFYIWVYLPFKKQTGRNTLPKEICNIFPFDIFYMRQNLSALDCKNIVDLLRRDLDAFVYVRDLDEQPPIAPYNVHVA